MRDGTGTNLLRANGLHYLLLAISLLHMTTRLPFIFKCVFTHYLLPDVSFVLSIINRQSSCCSGIDYTSIIPTANKNIHVYMLQYILTQVALKGVQTTFRNMVNFRKQTLHNKQRGCITINISQHRPRREHIELFKQVEVFMTILYIFQCTGLDQRRWQRYYMRKIRQICCPYFCLLCSLS